MGYGVRVAMVYGDAVSGLFPPSLHPSHPIHLPTPVFQPATTLTQTPGQDYICNWFGGEAVSLALNYTHSAEFTATGYAPFVVEGEEYGESRQYGNFSFTRIYESGHEIPYYQPKAALEFFRRILGDLVVADGTTKVTATFASNGTAEATHTETYVTWYTGRPEDEK